MQAVIMENKKADDKVTKGFEIFKASFKELAITPVPRIMTEKAAPNAAAWAMPRVKGDAKGFLKTDCMTAPELARPAPATTAVRVWGNLIFQMISSNCRESEFLKSVLITSMNPIWTDPREMLVIIIKIRAIKTRKINKIFFFIYLEYSSDISPFSKCILSTTFN
jgi:hypothetical protein